MNPILKTSGPRQTWVGPSGKNRLASLRPIPLPRPSFWDRLWVSDPLPHHHLLRMLELTPRSASAPPTRPPGEHAASGDVGLGDSVKIALRGRNGLSWEEERSQLLMAALTLTHHPNRGQSHVENGSAGCSNDGESTGDDDDGDAATTPAQHRPANATDDEGGVPSRCLCTASPSAAGPHSPERSPSLLRSKLTPRLTPLEATFSSKQAAHDSCKLQEDPPDSQDSKGF